MFTKALLSFLTFSLLASGCSTVSAKGPGQIFTFESDVNGFNTKNYFYDNGEEVVAFDTQFTPELAKKSIEFLRTKTQHPITYLVITHPNPDKFNGINVFREAGARIISSKATEESLAGVHAYKKYFFVEMAHMFTNENYPVLSSVDSSFETTEQIRLGNGEIIELKEFQKPGVSGNQTVAFIPKIKALIVGDLIHSKVHAWLEGGIVNGKATPTILSWISLLKELPKLYPVDSKVYAGRGEMGELSAVGIEQVKYLETADKIVISFVKNNPIAKATDGVKIQKLMEKSFPTYGLGYLIQYGVYGLVDSKR